MWGKKKSTVISNLSSLTNACEGKIDSSDSLLQVFRKLLQHIRGQIFKVVLINYVMWPLFKSIRIAQLSPSALLWKCTHLLFGSLKATNFFSLLWKVLLLLLFVCSFSCLGNFSLFALYFTIYPPNTILVSDFFLF